MATDFLQNDCIMKGYILTIPALYGGYPNLHSKAEDDPQRQQIYEQCRSEFVNQINTCLGDGTLGYESVTAMSKILAEIISRPGWNLINAVKNGRIIFIDCNLAERTGPRIGEGILLLNSGLYEN